MTSNSDGGNSGNGGSSDGVTAPFLEAMGAMGAEVADFHIRWPQLARLPSPLVEVAGETAALLEEEVEELQREIKAGDIELEATCEEAADVLFVAMGLLYRLGTPGAEAMRRVVAKNHAKTEATYFFDPTRRKVRPRAGRGS